MTGFSGGNSGGTIIIEADQVGVLVFKLAGREITYIVFLL